MAPLLLLLLLWSSSLFSQSGAAAAAACVLACYGSCSVAVALCGLFPMMVQTGLLPRSMPTWKPIDQSRRHPTIRSMRVTCDRDRGVKFGSDRDECGP